VDRRRIYSTGMSNGGYMSEHNACNAADVYAAVAPVSGMGSPRTDCTPSRPIPMIAFNGTADGLVSYETVSTSVWPAWVGREGCQGEPRRVAYGESHCDVYERCDGGIELTLCTVQGMEHCWPGNPLSIPSFCPGGGGMDIVANTMMYDFFERFALPD
jgi:polyhydroxybutyrate depolymerase